MAGYYLHHIGGSIAYTVAASFINFFLDLILIYLRPLAAISVQKSRPRQCLILTETNVLEVKMVKCIFCGSLIAAGRFVVPGSWICNACVIRLEEPLNWNTVGCRA